MTEFLIGVNFQFYPTNIWKYLSDNVAVNQKVTAIIYQFARIKRF